MTTGCSHRKPGELTQRERMELALRLASPKRAEAGRVIHGQADAGHLPLFIAADEPGLL